MDLIEWKAVFISLCIAAVYLTYRHIAKARPKEEPPETIPTATKMLIDELHELNARHTNLMQFLFDTEQEKETTYNISYLTATGEKKTAEIIKAVDSTKYMQDLSKQQIQIIESRMQYIIAELNKPIPLQVRNRPKCEKASDTSISKAVQSISKAVKFYKSGEYLKDQEEIERGVQTID